MSDHRILEYEEEDDDLFGNHSTNEAIPVNVNTAEPISTLTTSTSTFGGEQLSNKNRYTVSSPARTSNAQAGPSTGKVYKNVDDRLRELQETRRSGRDYERTNAIGVRSLRALCMSVVKASSARIWDIGDLEYPLIKPLLDDMPIEQLQEVETNSPHIKKDTDWLYEIFMLQDFPLFHERCQDRHGSPRKSGWRRMYKKAKEDFAVRQIQAADRVAARYKQLEEEKASKRIVVMDRIIPDKKPSARGSGWGRGKFGGSGTGGLSSSTPKPQNAIAKARLEAQRARVAMTHASGKYIPPAPQKSKNELNQLFKNPYLPQGFSQAAQQAMHAPRIPPPKSLVPKRQTQRASSPNSPTSPIPGSYPTNQINHIRQTLPSHLADRASQSIDSNTTEDRFRIEGNRSKYKEVKKKAVEKFVIPEIEKEKPTSVVVDFFASNPMLNKGNVAGVKRKEREEREKSDTKMTQIGASPYNKITSFQDGSSIAIPVKSTITPHQNTQNASTGSDVNNVLFRKKKTVKGR
ncbi:uncharacterized protein I206_102488 [Kwoniella pini CBS 10737]|uniref:Elongin-A n=1 Tax=Kwoniella pini CBS 10737 TaxID=1296096 RepID=A0A1B9I5H9_9TREE|nr:uncharacterized protein I206_02839 [Kwoniella pini CBS 10737]OCF50783.1 hypothetical protein I206_02839 [Kwoniella pini CBS 10737]